MGISCIFFRFFEPLLGTTKFDEYYHFCSHFFEKPRMILKIPRDILYTIEVPTYCNNSDKFNSWFFIENLLKSGTPLDTIFLVAFAICKISSRRYMRFSNEIYTTEMIFKKREKKKLQLLWLFSGVGNLVYTKLPRIRTTCLLPHFYFL